MRLVRSSLRAALALQCVATAAAAEPNVHLTVERDAAADGCLSERELARSVERRLGRRVFDEKRSAELLVRVAFTREPTWTARLSLSDNVGPLGKRELETPAKHCSALDDSVALVVALLVDTPPQRPEPPPDAPTANAPEKPSTPAAPPRVTRLSLPENTLAPREPFAFELRAAGALFVGSLPGVAPGAEVAFAVQPPRGPWVRLLAELGAPVDTSERIAPASVRFSTARVGLECCVSAIELGPSRAHLCVGQRIGRIVAESSGFDLEREKSRVFHALALGGDAVWPFGRSLGVFVAAQLEIPLTRDEFTARPSGTAEEVVFQPSVLGFSGKLGLRVEL